MAAATAPSCPKSGDPAEPLRLAVPPARIGNTLGHAVHSTSPARDTRAPRHSQPHSPDPTCASVGSCRCPTPSVPPWWHSPCGLGISVGWLRPGARASGKAKKGKKLRPGGRVFRKGGNPAEAGDATHQIGICRGGSADPCFSRTFSCHLAFMYAPGFDRLVQAREKRV